MSDSTTPTLEPVPGVGFRVRIRYGKGLRDRFVIKLTDAAAAEKRAQAMAELARMLNKAGHSEQAPLMLTKLGEADDAKAREIVNLAQRLCLGKVRVATRPNALSIRQLGEQWTSGDLHRRYPDQIREKRSVDDDKSILERHVYPVVGDRLVTSFSIEDAEGVMARLPARLATNTRRNIARTIGRLCSLAVYPLKLIPNSPIPRGFVPQSKGEMALAYLYPSEDAALMASNAPIAWRLLWGFLTREGMRAGEATVLRCGDIDLERGLVRLDENKSDDPRAWALSPGVAEALRRYFTFYRPDATAADLAFVDEYGHPFVGTSLPRTLRGHLEAIGLKENRPELFVTTEHRHRIRVHDLRGTFVTVSLANGRTESWVADRTGHKSSQMIARYKRTARTFAELGVGYLAPLVDAIPELSASEGVGHQVGQNLRRGWDSNPRITVLQTAA